MKTTLKTIFGIGCMAFVTVGCQKESIKISEELAKLKSVEFVEEAEKVIASEFVRITTHNLQPKKEVIQTVSKQQLLNPIEIVDGKDLDVIYPGSLLQGESFLQGRYTNLIAKNAKNITLSGTLQGTGLPVKIEAKPVLSDVRQKVNDLINEHRERLSVDNVASFLSYTSHEVNTKESFNKTFKIHANLNVLKGKVESNFSFEETNIATNGKKYVLIKVRQLFYNISVDPKSAEEWGEIENVGKYEPLYISSVDYGRVAHLLIETNESSAEMVKTIKAGISINFSHISSNVNVESRRKIEQLFRENKIQVMIAGGPLSHSKLVGDYESFINFLRNPQPHELVLSSAPIGYKVRRVKDNSEVDVLSTYTEKRIGYE